MSGEDADMSPPERVDDLKKSGEKTVEVPVNKEISRKYGFFVQEKPCFFLSCLYSREN